MKIKIKNIGLSIMTILTLFSLCGCNQLSDPTKRPKDTNITYWVTDELTQDEVDKMSMVMTTNFDTFYLDPLYQINKDSEGNNTLPDKYVAYEIGYLDNMDDKMQIIRILINDSKVSVYDITISSSEQEIAKNLNKYGYSINGVGTSGVGEFWLNNNIALRVPPFSKSGIEIYMY